MSYKKKILILALSFLLISSLTIGFFVPKLVYNFEIRDFDPNNKNVSNLKNKIIDIKVENISGKLSQQVFNKIHPKNFLNQLPFLFRCSLLFKDN